MVFVAFIEAYYLLVLQNKSSVLIGETLFVKIKDELRASPEVVDLFRTTMPQGLVAADSDMLLLREHLLRTYHRMRCNDFITKVKVHVRSGAPPLH